MPDHDYEIRRPRRADAVLLGALHVHVWRVTYRGIMPDAALAELSVEDHIARWAETGESYDTGTATDARDTWIATHHGVPVAFLVHGAPHDDDAPVAHQLWALNVAPEHQGSGIAQRLVDECLGSHPTYLWVARGNARAIAFYERNGFHFDGTTSTDQHDGMVARRMVRASSER